MKLFFYIATFIFSTTFTSAASEPLVSTKTGQPRVYASLPKNFGKTEYCNAIIERTQTGSFMFIKNPTVSEETFIFFCDENGGPWKEVGRVCSDLSDITYEIKDYGWELRVSGKNCAHTYKKTFEVNMVKYVED